MKYARVTNNKGWSKVPYGFLSFCYSLETVDLSALSDVTHIGDEVLMYCYRLKSIDLTVFSEVKYIGSNFASFSTCDMVSIDLRPLVNIEGIGNDFFATGEPSLQNG